MKALIVSGIVLTILLLSIMLGKKNKLYADKFLIIYLLFSVIRQALLYVEELGLLDHSYWLLLVKGLYLLQAPLFFFYVYSLTQLKPLRWKGYVFILAPFVIYAITFLYYYVWVFPFRDIEIVNGLLYINQALSTPWALFVFLFLIVDPVFLVWFYFLLRNYKKRVMQSLSYTERINLNWLNILFYLWFISAIILFPFSLVTVGRSWISTDTLELLVEIFMVAFFFVIGYYGFKQTTVFSNLMLNVPTEIKGETGSYERSGLSSQQAEQYHEKLLALMKEKKPYLNGELNANELAQELSISVNHLSQVLNKNQKQNFFDFVNSYRVMEVKEKMEDKRYQHLTLLAIALESGFNSKTSFNTIFKKVTSQTPSAYYKSFNEQNIAQVV